MPHFSAMALRSVDFPVPFSPTKKVTAVVKGKALVAFRLGRLKGYRSVTGYRSGKRATLFRCMGVSSLKNAGKVESGLMHNCREEASQA
jgi:hypothetical protein